MSGNRDMVWVYINLDKTIDRVESNDVVPASGDGHIRNGTDRGYKVLGHVDGILGPYVFCEELAT